MTVPDMVERIVKHGYEITESNYYKWENKNAVPPLDAMPAVAKALKLKSVKGFISKRVKTFNLMPYYGNKPLAFFCHLTTIELSSKTSVLKTIQAPLSVRLDKLNRQSGLILLC